MNALPQFSLPITGLGDGVHEFDFQVDDSFFEVFEASPVKEGSVKVAVTFDKKPDVSILTFQFDGIVKATCDRCLEEFDLPIESTESIFVKVAEEESDDPDVLHISKGAKKIPVAAIIYEFIILAIPLIKTHDLAREKCDEEMLKYLNQPIAEDESATTGENPIWGVLKNIKLN